MRCDGRTLVFLHAPAFVSETGLSRKRTEELTGFEITVQEGEAPLRMVDKLTHETVGNGKPQRGLFLPVGRPGDRIHATGTGPIEGLPVVAERDFRNWRSIYVAVPAVTPALFRDIYRRTGVHLYTDRDVVLSANSAWVMLHTKETGDYRVTLPSRMRKITEVTTEKVVGENLDFFTWKLDKFRTAIFLLER